MTTDKEQKGEGERVERVFHVFPIEIGLERNYLEFALNPLTLPCEQREQNVIASKLTTKVTTLLYRTIHNYTYYAQGEFRGKRRELRL